MVRENTWAPVIVCESCDDNTEAGFVLPQIGGGVSFVCWSHARDWYDQDSVHLRGAARRLASVHLKDLNHITDLPEGAQ